MVTQNDPSEAAYHAFMTRIQPVIGVDLTAYKQAQMNRRLKSLMNRWSMPDWKAFAETIESEPARLREFKDFITINVSEFFRGADKFLHLRDVVFPEIAERKRQIKIWSAGCSIGSEPYTMAMMLDSLGLLSRSSIIATDIDTTILARARSGAGYADSEIKEVPEEYLRKYFTKADEEWSVSPEIKSIISFRQHSLLKDPYPTGMDLIVCRNVVIYFTDPVKDKIYTGFYHALNPGGHVFVGGTEIMTGAREIGFTSPTVYFYQRPLDSGAGGSQ